MPTVAAPPLADVVVEGIRNVVVAAVAAPAEELKTSALLVALNVAICC